MNFSDILKIDLVLFSNRNFSGTILENGVCILKNCILENGNDAATRVCYLLAFVFYCC